MSLTGFPIKTNFQSKDYPKYFERTDAEYTTLPDPVGILMSRGFDVPFLAELLKEIQVGTIIGGGFFQSILTKKPIKDIDMFFQNEQGFWAQFDDISSKKGVYEGYELATDMAEFKQNTTKKRFVEFVNKDDRKPKLQLIKVRWFGSAEDLIDSFDFTAAQFAIQYGELVFNPLAIMDVIQKKLVMHRITFPSDSLRRMIKYTQKGYYACPGALMQMTKMIEESLKASPGLVNDVFYLD